MRFFFLLFISVCLIWTGCRQADQTTGTILLDGEEVLLSKADLQDKIKGGWAGQVIGCTYGGPTEFRYNGTMINDRWPIPWDEHQMLWWYENSPGLYDDVYMDLTFLDVFEKHGFDAPDSLHALAFAHAEYPLWHANQAARYNILHGIMPPASGHWKNNPHADDIDFQIESDFAGLMSPGMVRTSTEISNRIGHIMNYGDGVYGGMYVAAMYALAFVHDDLIFVVREALKVVPEQSDFYRCIADVIRWHEQYPDDWKSNWFEVQKHWSYDKGCPDGVFGTFNIDAKINAAYIVIGLLYGNGDFGKTVDISTRCGLDSDCNPANAGGILGALVGYRRIPDYWKQGIDKVEDINFPYMAMSLNDVYDIGMRHAMEMIQLQGGMESGENMVIKYQAPVPAQLEVGFEGVYPTKRQGINRSLTPGNPEYTMEMEGCGFVFRGQADKEGAMPDATLEIEVYIDGQLAEQVKMPTNWRERRHDVAWRYDLPEGRHNLRLLAKNLNNGYAVRVQDVILYSSIDPGPQNY